MKAARIPVPPPPPEVTLAMTEKEARLLLELSKINVSIPSAAEDRGLNRAEVENLLDSIRTVLRKVL